MNTKMVGDIAEAALIFFSLKRGWAISKPFGENQKYDLIIEKNNELLRVQCKSAKLNENGRIVVPLYTIESGNHNKKATKRAYKTDEIDAFGIYCPDTDECYLITKNDLSVNDDGEIQKNLNLLTSAPHGRNAEKQRLAEDYKI